MKAMAPSPAPGVVASGPLVAVWKTGLRKELMSAGWKPSTLTGHCRTQPATAERAARMATGTSITIPGSRAFMARPLRGSPRKTIPNSRKA